jgi:allantoin racemase
VQKAFTSPGQMTDNFLKESRRLASQGAEVILAACATVNAIIRRENITEVDGALIMDCNAVLLKTTEAMADLSKTIGLNASRKLLYQSPINADIDRWKQIYGFRSQAQLKP